MNYSNFLKNFPSISAGKNVKIKNRYRLRNPKSAQRKYKIRFILFFALVSFSALFAFSSYSTINSPATTSLSTSISDENKLNKVHTTTLELPEIAHHEEPIIEPVPPVELEKEIPDVTIDSAPVKTVQQLVVAEKHATPRPVAIKIDKANINKTLVSIKQKTAGEKQTIVIASSPLSTKIESQSKTIIVKKGDNLSLIFKRLSLSASTLYHIINSGKSAKKLQRIKPGQKITIHLLDNKFDSLHYAMNSVDTLIINKKGNQYISQVESKDIETRQQFAAVTIENSLFLAGNKAGLSSALIMEMAGIFGWDIDFALDVRKGDSFTVLYEEKFIDDKKFSNGHILSAEFINKGKSYTAVRFTDSSGHTDYYSAKGLSMRKAFLRTPVAFSRISSRFSYSRKHPVLNKTRPHKGVDYAASRGTPIKAVGKGKVIFKGTKGGYGRVIILQHGAKYSTLYAHMNSYNKKVRKGSQVTQGQTIGYVGSSGLATGPHLHYEFRVNGVHRNPLTVSLPTAAPIERKYRSEFQSTADTLISQLKLRKQETVAMKN